MLDVFVNLAVAESDDANFERIGFAVFKALRREGTNGAGLLRAVAVDVNDRVFRNEHVQDAGTKGRRFRGRNRFRRGARKVKLRRGLRNRRSGRGFRLNRGGRGRGNAGVDARLRQTGFRVQRVRFAGDVTVAAATRSGSAAGRFAGSPARIARAPARIADRPARIADVSRLAEEAHVAENVADAAKNVANRLARNVRRTITAPNGVRFARIANERARVAAVDRGRNAAAVNDAGFIAARRATGIAFVRGAREERRRSGHFADRQRFAGKEGTVVDDVFRFGALEKTAVEKTAERERARSDRQKRRRQRRAQRQTDDFHLKLLLKYQTTSADVLFVAVSQRKFFAPSTLGPRRAPKTRRLSPNAAAKINEDAQTSLLRYFVYIFS